MRHLPPTQPSLKTHTEEGGKTNASGVADRCCRETEFALLAWDLVGDISESVDVHQSTQKTFPEDDGKDNVDGGYEAKEGLHGQDDEIEKLQHRRQVEAAANTNERYRGARDEDADLVDGIVCWVEVPEAFKRRLSRRK